MNSPNQEAAVKLAELGYRVFPCINDPSNDERHKKPIVKGWQETSVFPAWQIGAKWASHPDALPAIPAGANGFIVIDCDRKPNAPDGVAAFTALCADRGIDLSNAFVVETPSTGLHFYWCTDTTYGNSSGSLPDGIDVRGIGGYVIAPGAQLADGRAYKIVQGSWSAIPALPDALAGLLRSKVDNGLPAPVQAPQNATERERSYAANALEDEAAKLSSMRAGDGRNHALNVSAHSLGTMAGAGWIDPSTVAAALFQAAQENGYVKKDGEHAAKATIESGLQAGMSKPREPLDAAIPLIDLSEMIERGIAAYKAKQASPKGPSFKAVSSKRTVTVLQCSMIEANQIEWLWSGYLPKGKLSLLAGAGGTGKSTIAFNFAGTISNAGLWPDGSRCSAAGNVLIWSSEDDAADTIVPRLMAVGANLERCVVINGAVDDQGLRCPFDVAYDMDQLREAVRQIGGISLFIIDPIVSAVTGDMNKANEVRRSLQAIVNFASETNCAVLGITHFAKGTAGKNSADRVIGSQAFSALARMVLVAAKEEDSQNRVFTRAKSNNSVDTGGFAYTIEAGTLSNGIETTRVVWGEPLEGSSRDILSTVEESNIEDTSKLGQAKRFLFEVLVNGPMESEEVKRQAKDVWGISERTLRRACKEAQVSTGPSGWKGKWFYSLPLSDQIAAIKRSA